MASKATEIICGGLTPVNPDRKDVQENAKFAVLQYNKEHGTNLIYKRATKASTQVVNGTMYYIEMIVVNALTDAIVEFPNVEAKVLDTTKGTKKLIEFNFLLNAPTPVCN